MTQLARYLEEPLADPEADARSYWKLQEKDCPQLSKVAFDYQTIEPTSTASERINSQVWTMLRISWGI